MIVPNAELLLKIWEENHAAHPIRRALTLLDAAWPGIGTAAWAQASIGERDACLLGLYESLFGTRLRTVAACPACGVRLESSFDVDAIRSRTPALPAPRASLHLLEQDYDIEYRLPSSDDLLQVAATATDRGGASAQLLQRCVIRACKDGVAADAAQLPVELAQRLAAAMAQHDPDADVRVGLACPACRHAWQLGFDIVSYLWDELEDWAQRTLAEVHALARAYAWSEREILGLSPTRRQLYLDLVRA